MRWDDFRRSDNVEDQTGMGGGRFPIGGGGLRLSGGALILLVIVGLIFGINPLDLLNGGGGAPVPAPSQPAPGYGPQVGSGPSQAQPKAPVQRGSQKDFVYAILGSTEDVWDAVFRSYVRRPYEKPALVLFSGRAESACGMASAAVGPFYCPGDRKVYLDTAFFDELSRRFGAPGDFAQAYVIAHEIGHHVQNQLGTMQQVDRANARADGRQRNATSVRVELQADCYAGVWAYHVRDKMDPGDLEEGLRAAAAVGDDEIQRRSTGTVRPDSFTHGSSEERVRWFRLGLQSGDPRQCDTFAGR